MAFALSQIDAFAGQERMTRREREVVAALRAGDCAGGGIAGEQAKRSNHASTVRAGARSAAFAGPAISICGVAELGEFSDRGITHMVSIWDRCAVADDAVRRRMKAACPKVRKHYAFFDDLLRPENHAPTMDSVRGILDFTGNLHRGDRLLVHCTKGISRSTAIAFATLCQHAGPGREAECLARVRQDRPIAKPNALIVRYADSILGRNGAMLAALQTKPE